MRHDGTGRSGQHARRGRGPEHVGGEDDPAAGQVHRPRLGGGHPGIGQQPVAAARSDSPSTAVPAHVPSTSTTLPAARRTRTVHGVPGRARGGRLSSPGAAARVGVVGIQRAVSVARDSRITVTLIWPG